MILPNEIVSVLEDLGFPIDGVPRKLHAAEIDQQHGRKLPLSTTGGFLIFQRVRQWKQQQDPGENSSRTFTDSQCLSRQTFSSEKCTIYK